MFPKSFCAIVTLLNLVSSAFADVGLQYGIINDLLSGRARQATFNLGQNQQISNLQLPKGRIFVTDFSCSIFHYDPIGFVPGTPKIAMSFVSDSGNTVAQWSGPQGFDVTQQFANLPYINNRQDGYTLRFATPLRANICTVTIIIYH